MDKLRCIEIFIHVSDAGSFSKAAKDFGVTPQAISRNIKELESWAGVRLLNRTTREVTLTAEGERFKHDCLKGIGQLENAINSLKSHSKKASGNIRVAVRPGFSKTFLAPNMPAFFKKFPDITVELIVENTIPNLVHDRIDIAFECGELVDSAIVAKRIASTPLMLCGSTEYVDKFGESAILDNLEEHMLITQRSPLNLQLRPNMFYSSTNFPRGMHPGNLITNDGDTILQAVMNDGGIAQFAYYRLAPYIAAGLIKVISENSKPSELPLYLLFPQKSYLPEKIKVFQDFFVKAILESGVLKPS